MKKVVQDLTSGGIDWQREKWQSGLGSKFIHQGEKNAVKYADEVIVLSKGVQDYFKETYGRKTHFIPNGVNRPQTREANLITDKFGLKKDSYILFLGRLVPEKGIRYLVEAFKNVKTDKKLVIAGGSSDTDSFMKELKELAKGDDRILFTGFVQGAMLDELYSNAYIYTLPSDLEGMPLSLLEAMSYGNCCLVSDIPECAEVVEDKALIFQKTNVEDACSVQTSGPARSLGTAGTNRGQPCRYCDPRRICTGAKGHYAAAWKSSGRELHKTPVSAEGKGLLWLLPEIDEISCSQEAWPLV